MRSAPPPASESVRGRFAPSPTGELHVGNARTALLAWLQVRSQGGALVMRLEDLDRARVVPGAAERQLASLRALGLDWDEGPGVGGPAGPYVQSERLEHYTRAFAELDTAGLLYPCFCSRAEIARSATAPHGPMDDGPPYPGTCRELTVAQRAERARGRPPAWRFRAAAGEVRFVDLVQGEQRQDVSREVGDFVVRRGDGVFAYQLAVVVDDAAMQITDVLRGADLLSSTARQIQLHLALGSTPPRWAHVPLVLGLEGERLSKRDGPVSIQVLLERGVPPERLVQELAMLSGMQRSAAVSPADLIAGFELGRVPKEAPRWSPRALLGG